MKKSRIAKAVLILSLLVFIGLLGFYIYTVQSNKPVTVSKREQYQNELLQRGEEN